MRQFKFFGREGNTACTKRCLELERSIEEAIAARFAASLACGHLICEEGASLFQELTSTLCVAALSNERKL